MPTYSQLQTEVWWTREYQPPSVAELCRRLREHYKVSSVAIGSKGDNNHLYGYHRSRAWVLNSGYCTNRSYSVSETAGNRAGGDPNWLCAVDMTIPGPELIAACQRLDAAVRAGLLEKVTEWYGNDDGDSRVDGYDNVRNVVASSDDSHLWHLHISLDRGRAGEDHSDLYEILTGEDDMDPEVKQWVKDLHYLFFTLDSAVRPAGSEAGKIETIRKAVTSGGGPGGLTADQVRAIVREELDKTKLAGA